ncbi:MAG: nucleotide diphosphate kinase [Candidatus Parcubacteria bacterium]|jgi:nucleoside-diphosphate kinase
MPKQKTLVIVKPDGVMNGYIGAIKAVYLKAGLEIIDQYSLVFKLEQASEFYNEHRGRTFFSGLILAMSSGPCEVMILEGENAIEIVRELNGATKPDQALPGTIRKEFPSAGGPFNVVHASDSKTAYAREFKIVATIVAKQESIMA